MLWWKRYLRGCEKYIHSTAEPPIGPDTPSDFLDILREWGNTWLWDYLTLHGGSDWLVTEISDGTLLAITDGSYIWEQYPNLCSVAFILDCSQGRGRLIKSFSEASAAANAYCWELLGLMAIHLLLLTVHTCHPDIEGSVLVIYSDCLGVLGRMVDLTPHCIPSRCQHLDILKTILVNLGCFLLDREFWHVAAHQDDNKAWDNMSQASQLNALCDTLASPAIWSRNVTCLPPQQGFPLEPICMFVWGKKITSDTGAQIWFAAGREVARSFFHERSILSTDAFDEVDWPSIHRTLCNKVLHLFHVWACKQVMDIAVTSKNMRRHLRHGRSKKCPCCTIAVEMADHIVRYSEAGQVEAFTNGATVLETWLDKAYTDPDLAKVIVEYVQGWDYITTSEVEREAPRMLRQLGHSQDVIGWCLFLEGMVSKEITSLQLQYVAVSGS